MSIQLTVPPKRELKPRIVVFGVGGAGGNAVNNMIAAGLEGVDFVVANTDAQALANSSADRRIQIGSKLTEGLGAGSNPEVGKGAAEETMPEIVDMLQGSHMAFVTAGMGGGTGTGAAPVIARVAREQGILTVGVVTKPFDFEGGRRMRAALEGIEELANEVDTLIIIPNQNLFRIANAQTTFAEAFAMADEVLHSGVAGITDLMIKPGLMNLDFADVRAVMNEMGKAMMGTGEAEGEKRAIEAAEAAIANPLLDDVSMQGARGVLINITGGEDMTLYELDEAANRIKQEVDSEANIIVGSTFDEALSGSMRVSVVATGIDAEMARLQALNGGRVIPMTASEPDPIVPETVVNEPAAETPMAEMSPAQEVQEAQPQPQVQAQNEASDLPGFLSGQQAEKPAQQQISKRGRSFIDRVFGAKKGNPPEQSRAAPRIDMGDADKEAQSEAPAAPLEVAEAKAAEESPMGQPAAFMEDLDGATPEEAPAPTPEPVAATAEISAPEVVIEAPAEIETEEVAIVEEKAPAAEAPIVEAKAEAPKAEAPIVQTTMQTGMSASSSSSYDAEQLDIPAFLRR